MPDRMIRDELLTSNAYWSCSPEARNLFLSILLSADDTGRFTASNFALRVRCMAGTVDSERVEKLLMELVDAKLVVVYGDGRFLFVPKFRQRLRYPHSKYPPPPNEINDITEKKSVFGLTEDGPKPDRSRSEDGPKTAEVKRSEVKRSKTSSSTAVDGGTSFDAFWSAYPRKVGKASALKAWAKLKVDDKLQATIMGALTVQRQSEQWRRDGGKFVPHAATWLNGRRWEDEVAEPERRWV